MGLKERKLSCYANMPRKTVHADVVTLAKRLQSFLTGFLEKIFRKRFGESQEFLRFFGTVPHRLFKKGFL